jgi:YcxB-like protein
VSYPHRHHTSKPMSDIHRVQFIYSRGFIFRAHARLRLRELGWHGAIGLVAGVAFSIFLLRHERDYIFGLIFLTALATVSLLYSVFYVTALYRHLSLLSEETSVELEFDENVLRVRTSLAFSELNWKAIQKIRKFAEVWMLFLRGGGCMMIPAQALSPGQKAFISDRLTEAGVKGA